MKRMKASLSLVLVTALQALADGPPQVDPLVYSGLLEENGAPVTGQRDIVVVLWNDATQSNPSNKQCEPRPQGKVQVSTGRFSVPLNATCAAAVKQNAELWVEVLVEGQSFGRRKLGAVPFAIEAERATDASGALKARLDGLAAYVNPTTGRRFSLNGSSCGTSTLVTGNISGGGATSYAAAKALCEQSCGRPTAHMCTGDEVLRFVSTGGTFPTSRAGPTFRGWDASAQMAMVNNGSIANDCHAWSSASGVGAVWRWTTQQPGGGPDVFDCSVPTPVLCCD